MATCSIRAPHSGPPSHAHGTAPSAGDFQNPVVTGRLVQAMSFLGAGQGRAGPCLRGVCPDGPGLVSPSSAEMNVRGGQREAAEPRGPHRHNFWVQSQEWSALGCWSPSSLPVSARWVPGSSKAGR